MKLNEQLVEVIEAEAVFQNKENLAHDAAYRSQAKYHTKVVKKLLAKVKKYPHFAVALLEDHINKEEPIFGQEVSEAPLTPKEKGRIYSLVRCRHMLRVAKERAGV